MSRKRGLSLDEKRQRMQEIFFEKKGVFQLKEIEKIAPKEKGITPMAVKDVLQSLVDDGLVDSDRIGTSNYYWAFPSKASQVDERGELLKVLSEKETDNGRLDAELERFRECDPEVIEEVKAEAAVAKEATNRWTDNVFSIKSWCKKKFSLEEKLLDKQFGIPEDFDYLD
ncbi:meiotic nuclear division protein 1 homolog isoform X2 [Strongylocentrotus purpuratus]|uniref:Meiotic nuclear division protein 1 homolog n=1 Tax=Strongylocentrotus purpuratus TaxID=7668 RepID=A0A7M7PAB0_STRPU|nr:meiotic nuclear division protein 1 homolog isoform X2 [Strongylocentrotus purpuratus]